VTVPHSKKAKGRADQNPLTDLDKLHLDALIAKHPRSAIQVNHGFGDGKEGRQFGYVPHDWDGTSVVYEFHLVPLAHGT
jgi:hypothetical protein